MESFIHLWPPTSISNERLYVLFLVLGSGFESRRIVKDEARVAREYELMVDIVNSPLKGE